MSLRLLLDEDTQAKLLASLLRANQHTVITANDAKLMGKSDADVLAYARRNDYVVVTRNCEDFRELHQLNTSHS